MLAKRRGWKKQPAPLPQRGVRGASCLAGRTDSTPTPSPCLHCCWGRLWGDALGWGLRLSHWEGNSRRLSLLQMRPVNSRRQSSPRPHEAATPPVSKQPELWALTLPFPLPHALLPKDSLRWAVSSADAC